MTGTLKGIDDLQGAVLTLPAPALGTSKNIISDPKGKKLPTVIITKDKEKQTPPGQSKRKQVVLHNALSLHSITMRPNFGDLDARPQ